MHPARHITRSVFSLTAHLHFSTSTSLRVELHACVYTSQTFPYMYVCMCDCFIPQMKGYWDDYLELCCVVEEGKKTVTEPPKPL